MVISILKTLRTIRSKHTRSLGLLTGSVCCLAVIVANEASAQSNSEEFQETLLNAERAIMEDLSAQAVGAAPVKPQPVVAAQPATKEPLPAAREPKVAPKKAAAVVSAPKPVKKEVPLEQPKASDADVRSAALSRENEALRKELSSVREEVTKLEGELRDTRNQLSVAETEVNRLSTVVDAKTRASLGRYNVPLPAAPQPTVDVPRPVPVAPLAKKVSDVKPPSAEAELQIATITADKADLRLGPGKNNSPLMTLRRGSRLAVEERQGEWYRVFAPNGQRAWIHSSLVSFGDGASDMNDGSAVRVKGYSSSAEEEAFRRLQKISGGK